MRQTIKVGPIIFINTDHYSQCIQGFTLALGNIFDDAICEVGCGKPRLTTVVYRVMGLTTIGTGAHTKYSITGGTISEGG